MDTQDALGLARSGAAFNGRADAEAGERGRLTRMRRRVVWRKKK